MGSKEKVEARKNLLALISQRKQVDRNIDRLGRLVLGNANPKVLNNVRPTGQPLVDDWNCLKNLVSYIHPFFFIYINAYLLIFLVFTQLRLNIEIILKKLQKIIN